MEHRQQYGSSHGDPWYDGGAYAAGPPGDRWDEPWTDTRTSVFDPPVYDDPPASYDPAAYDSPVYEDPPASYDPAVYDSPDPGPAAGGETYLEDEIPDEEVRQTSVIDSDPFAGRSSSLRRRYGEHYRRDEPLPDEDDDGPRSAVVHRLMIGGLAATAILLVGAFAFLAGAGDGDAAPEGALPSTTEAGDTSTTPAPTTSAPGVPAGEPSADNPAGTSTTSGPAAPADPPRPGAPSAPSTTAPASATPSTTAADGNAPPTNPPPTTAPSGGSDAGGGGGRDGDRPDEDNDTLLELLGLG